MAFKGQRGVVRQTKAIGRGPDRAGPSSSRYLLLFFFFRFALLSLAGGRRQAGGEAEGDAPRMGPLRVARTGLSPTAPPGHIRPLAGPGPGPGHFLAGSSCPVPFAMMSLCLCLYERPMLLSSFFFPLSISQRKEMNEDKGESVA